MNGNPYGAVPAALSETRLTLRDIMADLLANKVAEGRLRLEQSRAETETAMVGAGVEKDRLSNLREMAQMRMTREMHDEAAARAAGQFEKTFGIQEKELVLREQAQADQTRLAEGQLELGKENVKVAQARVRVEEAAGLREAAKLKRETEIRTIGDWAGAAGIHPGLIEFLGVDPAKKITRTDAENLYATIQTTFKANPSMGLMAHGFGLKTDLLGLQEQLKKPGLTPDQAAGIKKIYDRKLAQFENLDKLIMAESAPDQSKIVSAARSTWSDNPQFATEYGTFDKFLTTYQKEVGQARGVFQEDIAALKNPTTTTPAEQKEALDGIRAAVKEIQAGKYALSPQELKVIQNMTSQVAPEKAAQKFRGLKNILAATPKKAQATAFAGGEPWKTVQ